MRPISLAPIARRAPLPERFWRFAPPATPARLAISCLAALAFLAGAVSLGGGAAIKAKAVLAQILLERAWAQSVESGAPARPWPSADMVPVLRLSAPAHNQTAIVLGGVSGEALAFGPGLAHGTRPGQPGLAVIAAHRDTHFQFLRDVAPGDVIHITDITGATRRFVIEETRIVDADRPALPASDDIARIALVTCWPFDAIAQGPERFAAIGRLSG